MLTAPAFAQNFKVAVAANLQSVIKVLGQDFKQKNRNPNRPHCRLIREFDSPGT